MKTKDAEVRVEGTAAAPSFIPPKGSTASAVNYNAPIMTTTCINSNSTTSTTTYGTGSTASTVVDDAIPTTPRYNRMKVIAEQKQSKESPIPSSFVSSERLDVKKQHQHSQYDESLIPLVAFNHRDPTAESNTDTTTTSTTTKRDVQEQMKLFIYYCIYAIINVIISVPGLYGYTAIIFHHPIFLVYRNTLCKLVICSSLVHQLSMTIFSTLHTFAIGTVQDAGLIFLATMASNIAIKILNDYDIDSGDIDTLPAHDVIVKQILSTTLVLLSLGTAALGFVLIIMGHFRFADAVSYLPMPVIGGYLAFIGYFCIEAGIGLAISQNIMSIQDWLMLFQSSKNMVLALPAFIAGFILTYITRNVKNDIVLPLAMIFIPGLFYFVIISCNIGMDGARNGGWMGDVTAPVPVTDLFRLVDFSLVRWDLIPTIFPTWVGMVFVVSFSSCLDVAAIAMDMGEALDTNMELKTVGIGNLLSGLTFGYTGSYIFSQTIFTYRTGVHSRWIGIFIILVFAYVIASPINVLEVVPLFFLGSTLVFIGYDLLYEWLFEVRSKIFLSEYAIVWATFLAIQVVGMDAGIVIGVLVSIVDHVVHSAKSTGIARVNKRSRSVWTPEQHKLLQDQGYHLGSPKIVTLEVSGNVFFGSSLGLLQRIIDELGISMQDESIREKSAFRSPHVSPFQVLNDRRRPLTTNGTSRNQAPPRTPPQFLTLDLSRLHNLDASACRGCFLQLVRICAKRGITVCACNASARVEWMLRSHDVSYNIEDEHRIKDQHSTKSENVDSTRLLLFVTVHEALEYCEVSLIQRIGQSSSNIVGKLTKTVFNAKESSLAQVFSQILGCSPYEEGVLNQLNDRRYHQELVFQAGQDIFTLHTHSDAFFVVLKGAVAVKIESDDPRFRDKRRTDIASGAGLVRSIGSISNLLDPSIRQDSSTTLTIVASVWPVGGVFGYVDFLLERPRHFRTVATQNETIVAKISMSNLRHMQSEDPVLDGLVQRVLLQASLLDLANCTCEE